MKKLVMTVAVLGCAASFVSAQVVSVNTVGYAKITAVEGQLSLVALNFEPSSTLVSDLIGDQLPINSKLHIWDKTSGGYNTVVNGTRGGWGNTATVDVGDAFWVELPAGSGTNELVLSGDVLMSETNSATIGGPIDMTGFFYPVDILWGDTDLAGQLPINAKLHIWNGSGYDTFVNGTRGGWGTGGNAVLITPSTGFWVEAPVTSWDETRPFTP